MKPHRLPRPRALLTITLGLTLGGCGARPSENTRRGGQAVTAGDVYNLGTLAHPGSCMDARSGGTTNGTQIQEYACNGTGAQSYQLEDAGGGAFFILNTQANKCVDVQGAGTADGTNIQLYDCNGTGAQKFVTQDAGNGLVYLVNTSSNKCLDVQGDNPNDGTVVQLYGCNQTNSQTWNPTAVGAGGGPGRTKAVMYLDNWSGNFASWATKIDFTKLTHLNLAFATVTGTNSWGSSPGATADVQTIAAAAHAKNVKVLVSLGGGGGDQSVIGAYKSASNIGPLVANLDTMVTAMNLDGVDVDLESSGDMTSSGNYPAFVSALISTFHPEGKLVTTALAQYIAQGQNPDATIVATLNSFDFVNDMIYSANLSDFSNEAAWWTGSPVGLPKEKLVWGVCFDGECANPSVAVVKQITTASKAYGGIMIWDYTDSSVGSTMWPAIQSEL